MFAVIYRWRLVEGKEDEFLSAWSELTQEFRATHGGLGSCLHRLDSGEYLAYARWPSRAAWETERDIVNQAALQIMQRCVLERFDPLPLTVLEDLLVHH